MGEIRTRDKRDKLRLLYAGLSGSGKRLRESLYDSLRACDEALSGPTPGTFISSTGEAGGSVSFSTVMGFTPMDAKRLVGELLDLHDSCVLKIDGGDPDDTDTYTDAAVYKSMMGLLVAVRRFRNDYTGLRYGAGYYMAT